MLKTESSLKDATDRAAALLDELRLRMNRETPVNPDDLDRELQTYFATAARPSVLNEIRDRVVDGVVDRILRVWEEPGAVSGAIEAAVVERLIERVLERLGPKQPPRPR